MRSKKAARVSIKDIAKAAGLSAATVSLALRGDPRIAQATTAAVRAMADKLGYRPDPHLSQLMGYLQKGRAHGTGMVIAVMTDFNEDELRAHPYQSRILLGIEERCAQFGYNAAVFTPGPKLGLKRLRGILDARGIEGLIILSFRKGVFSLDEFDFARLAAVTVGYGMQSPQLHRVASQQTLAAMRVVERVMECGYKRLGMVLPEEIDLRTQHRYLAGFLGRMASEGTKPGPIPPFLFEQMDPARLRAWIARHRIDAIVSNYREMPETLEQLGLVPGQDIGLAMLDYRGQRQLAHMQVPYASLGRSAVNLVHSLLCTNERGLPELPSVLTVPGVWVDGASLPPRG